VIHQHTITLASAAANESGLSSYVLRDLFDVLVKGAEQSLRFRIEGRSVSTASGPSPSWLRPASDFQMIDLQRTDSSRTMRIETRSLIDSMPDKFPPR
jgi:hypothetical protein